MKTRILGKTGYTVSEVSLGTWQVGGGWGASFDLEEAVRTVETALDQGVTFIDTADVYGNGDSERAVAEALRRRGLLGGNRVRVATKCGRRLSPHIADGYTAENLTGFVEDSLRNMGLETLDLVQLHCPPTDVYYRPAVFDAMDRLQAQGKIRHYGVSVERVEEALKAIEFPGVATVQIIYNMFRQRPAERFFAEAAARNVGVIVRVPLASGLLTGKMRRDTAFAAGDHRAFNREGAAFDRGETFAGVDYETGLRAVEALREVFPEVPGGPSLAQIALRWVLMEPAVSCVIPGASREAQARANAAASGLPPLTPEQMAAVRRIYDTYLRPMVHPCW
ncbi:MAG: aldo/keto reductase [Clostridia bacterium]|nr:aldo/keto reductase [Clostridia bacterium]